MISNQIVYTQNPINRASLLRKDQNWIDKQFETEQARVIILWQNKSLVQSENGHNTILLDITESLLEFREGFTFLGVEEELTVFSLDLSDHEEGAILALFDRGELRNLRGTSSTLKPNEASLLAYALGLTNWKRSYLYCYRCGSKLSYQESGHVKVCSNTSCGHVTYPRTDPAVIVLIEHKPKEGAPVCLLARHARYKAKMISTLAGFVEPGETLEHAVEREMMEEVGLEVHNIRYIGSQPWPFPASLMLGFMATSNSLELNLDLDEVEEASWYTADELVSKSKSGEIILSGKDSIARYMINQWIDQHSR